MSLPLSVLLGTVLFPDLPEASIISAELARGEQILILLSTDKIGIKL